MTTRMAWRGALARIGLAACAIGVSVAAVQLFGGRGAVAQPSAAAAAFDAQAIVAGLLQTPGCLGAETAQTMSGKGVIFAWFEDKAAAMAWYTSPTHQHAMSAVFPDFEDAGSPMQGIPDDVPIMAIASITPGAAPNGAIGGAPLSQIAIELYTPLKGGIHIGGTFAPEGLKVPGMKNVGG